MRRGLYPAGGVTRTHGQSGFFLKNAVMYSANGRENSWRVGVRWTQKRVFAAALAFPFPFVFAIAFVSSSESVASEE